LLEINFTIMKRKIKCEKRWSTIQYLELEITEEEYIQIQEEYEGDPTGFIWDNSRFDDMIEIDEDCYDDDELYTIE